MIPVFDAKEASDAEAASRFFRAAIECTNREPDAHEVVRIKRNLEHPWAAGFAHSDDDGLFEIELGQYESLGTLAHEIAHAWINGGPTGLVEGRTDLLMTCIADKVPELLAGPSFGSSTLKHMVDLRSVGKVSDSDDPAMVHATYEGSYRLFRSAAVAIPRETLWAEDLTTWEEFEAVLSAFPKASPLLEALRGGAEAQRAALADKDGDSRTAVAEAILGTSDETWDTDGDGWWDGSELRKHPEAAVALPRDGSPICLTRMVQDFSQKLVVGGDLAGFDTSGLFRSSWIGSFYRMTPSMQERSGGVWIGVESLSGAKIVLNPECAVSDRVTARSTSWVKPGLLVDLVAAVDRVLDRNPELPAPITGRVVLEVDNDADVYVHYVGEHLRISHGLLEDAHPGKLDALASAIVARQSVHNLGVNRLDDNAFAGVIAKRIAEHPVIWYSAPSYEVGLWKRAVKRCDEGLEGLKSGYCKVP